MSTVRPALDALTPRLVGSTITLRDGTTQVTGLLTGIYVDGWIERTYGGDVSVEGVAVSARFDRAGSDWDVPVAPDMTLEVHE